MLIFIVSLLLCLTVSACQKSAAIIKIHTKGTKASVQGKSILSNGTEVGWMFAGIRFAQPPVGKLRFEYAQRHDPSGFVNATAYGKDCSSGLLVNEDCLFLNIYTPVGVCDKKKYPVLFHIHGGGLETGSSQMNTAIFDTLIARGPIVIVSVSYRLGPFGLFTSRDSTIPGNYAISDMVEALQWTHRYIKFFGGDPKRITINGESSGAESVSALTLSPVTKGMWMFKQAMMESGSAFGGGVAMCETRNASMQLAMQLGCATEDTWKSGKYFEKILRCMRDLNASDIQFADNSMTYHPFMYWGFVMDSLYLPDTLDKLALNRPKYNILMGATSLEWLSWSHSDIISGKMYTDEYTRKGLIRKLRNTFEMQCWNNSEDVMFGAQIYYIDSAFLPDNDHVGYMKIWTELMSHLDFTAAVLRDAKYFAYTGSNTYLYSFDYLSPLSLSWLNETRLRGAPHVLEMVYLYYNTCLDYKCQAPDYELREKIQEAWINFIMTGNPNPPTKNTSFVWPKLENDDFNNYLSWMPKPEAKKKFHKATEYFACVAPTLSGFRPPFCKVFDKIK